MEGPLAQHLGPQAPHTLTTQRVQQVNVVSAQRGQLVEPSNPQLASIPQAQGQPARNAVPFNCQNDGKRVHIADCIDFRRYGPGGCKRQQEGKECPYRHMDYTKRAGFCHQYDQSRGHFCSRGRDCKYYHASTRRTACIKFQSGQCPKAAHHCLYSHDPTICGMPPQTGIQQQAPRSSPTLQNQNGQFGQNMQQRQFFGQQQYAMQQMNYTRPQMAMAMQNQQFAFGGYPQRMMAQQYQYALGFNGGYNQMMHPGMMQQFHGGGMMPHQQHHQQHHSNHQQYHLNHHQEEAAHDKSEARELTDASHVVPPNTFKKWEDVRPDTPDGESPAKKPETEGTPEVPSPINNARGFDFTLRMKEDIEDKAPVKDSNGSEDPKKDPKTPGSNEVMAAELRAKLIAKREIEASKSPESSKICVVAADNHGPVDATPPKAHVSSTFAVDDPNVFDLATEEATERGDRSSADNKRKRSVTPVGAYNSDDEYDRDTKRAKSAGSPSSSSYVEEDSVDFDLDEL